MMRQYDKQDAAMTSHRIFEFEVAKAARDGELAIDARDI